MKRLYALMAIATLALTGSVQTRENYEVNYKKEGSVCTVTDIDANNANAAAELLTSVHNNSGCTTFHVQKTELDNYTGHPAIDDLVKKSKVIELRKGGFLNARKHMFYEYQHTK